MNKNILLSFYNGIGNWIMLTPCIQALKSMGWDVDIILGVEKIDPRYTAFEDIIDNYDGVGFYNKDKQYDVGFYIWGEGGRWLPSVNVKEWKLTKESTNPVQYFLDGNHEVKLNMTIAKHLGYEGNIPDTYCPVKKWDWKVEKDLFPNICIHVGSRPEVHWKKKRWPNDNWIDLFKKFKIQEYNIHFLVGEWDIEDAEYIDESLLHQDIYDNDKINKQLSYLSFYCKRSITEIAYLISKCDLMISTDSGPMHIANAVGTPVIQLFGPTLTSKNSAWNNNGRSVLKGQVPCSPCLYTNKFMECKDNICMKAITPEEVYIDVERILESQREVVLC